MYIINKYYNYPSYKEFCSEFYVSKQVNSFLRSGTECKASFTPKYFCSCRLNGAEIQSEIQSVTGCISTKNFKIMCGSEDDAQLTQLPRHTWNENQICMLAKYVDISNSQIKRQSSGADPMIANIRTIEIH